MFGENFNSNIFYLFDFGYDIILTLVTEYVRTLSLSSSNTNLQFSVILMTLVLIGFWQDDVDYPFWKFGATFLWIFQGRG